MDDKEIEQELHSKHLFICEDCACKCMLWKSGDGIPSFCIARAYSDKKRLRCNWIVVILGHSIDDSDAPRVSQAQPVASSHTEHRED